MSTYVLDTSALLAYIEDEDGANEVDHVLNDAMDDRHTVYISDLCKSKIKLALRHLLWEYL